MTMTTDKPTGAQPDEPGSYWASPKTIGAALVLSVLAGLGAWVTTHGGGDQHGGPAAAGAGYESACGLKGGDTAPPTTTPVIQWRNVGLTYLPTTTAYGPGRISADGPWSCFSRTPAGAVLAAWTIPYRIATAKDFQAVVKAQTAAGPTQDALLKQGQDHSPASPIIPMAFAIDAYTPDAAQIGFRIQQAGNDYTCTSAVQWVGGSSGDWQLRIAPNGNVLLGCTPGYAPDSAGSPKYVAWGPR